MSQGDEEIVQDTIKCDDCDGAGGSCFRCDGTGELCNHCGESTEACQCDEIGGDT